MGLHNLLVPPSVTARIRSVLCIAIPVCLVVDNQHHWLLSPLVWQQSEAGQAQNLEPTCLDSKPGSFTYLLCDQVTHELRMLLFSHLWNGNNNWFPLREELVEWRCIKGLETVPGAKEVLHSISCYYCLYDSQQSARMICYNRNQTIPLLCSNPVPGSPPGFLQGHMSFDRLYHSLLGSVPATLSLGFLAHTGSSSPRDLSTCCWLGREHPFPREPRGFSPALHSKITFSMRSSLTTLFKIKPKCSPFLFFSALSFSLVLITI